MMVGFLGVLNIVLIYVNKPHPVATYASVTPT